MCRTSITLSLNCIPILLLHNLLLYSSMVIHYLKQHLHFFVLFLLCSTNCQLCHVSHINSTALLYCNAITCIILCNLTFHRSFNCITITHSGGGRQFSLGGLVIEAAKQPSYRTKRGNFFTLLKAGSALVISHALQLKAQKSRQR